MGVALTGCGEAESALGPYDKALAMRPDFHQAWFNKGVALDNLKRFDDALQCYDRALSIDPGFATAWYNRGATLNDLGRHHEALASHDKALALEPGNAQAWSNRGVTLSALKCYKEALESHEKALTLEPDFAEAWGRGAGVFADLKSPEKALTYFAKALALKPDIPFLPGDWLRARMSICQWEAAGAGALSAATVTADARAPARSDGASDIERQFEKILSGIDAKRKMSAPFVVLAIPSSLAQQRHCAEIYCRDRSPATVATVQRVKRAQRARIKVGYFSPDFRSHAVSFLTAGLFECHDPARFETHAFAFGVPGDDPMTRRVKSAFEHFHDVEKMPDREIALLAQSLNIDIAVDLAGHTQGARTGIFARRAAPVQVNYLGFPGTMGAEFIDYIISDEIVTPDGDLNEYSEKVVFLPHCFQVNDSKRHIAHAPTRTSCGLADEAFVYCCFSNAYKLNPGIFDIWMNILRSTDHGVLWLIGEHKTQMQNLRNWAAARGVSPHRLVFAGMLPYAEHLARYPLADLVLDTLPFNGGTTTSDALWGGAPVLTCSGNTFAGRMAASLLRAIGLDELVTNTLDAYQASALHFAHHPAEIAALKKRLAVNRDSHPLFDTRLCTRHIETAYVEMWRRHDAGLPPAHLRIPPAQSTPEGRLNRVKNPLA